MILRKKNTSSRLRQRLTLQKETRVSDGAGGYSRSWQDIADLWAEIIPLSGKERLFAEQIEAPISHKILLRYRSDITPDNRLVFEGRIFNIRYVFNVNENNEALEILAEEGVAA